MKKFGAMGVPRKPPKVPWNCQPLFARSPVGAVVLAAGAPVPRRITARALEPARAIAARQERKERVRGFMQARES